MRTMDIFRMEFRQFYIIALINTIILFLAMIITFTLPQITNKFYYYDYNSLTSSNVS